MTLRKARNSDASSLAAISIEVWLGTYIKQGVNSLFADYVLHEFTSEKLAQRIADPNQFFLVSQNNQGIDGFIQVSTGSPSPVQDNSTTEISTFYVQPRHHGKGVGKQLLKGALQHCREQSAESVWLATNAENTPAIAFYLAQGFSHIGETHFRMGKEAYLNNVYAYPLI